MFIAFKGFKVDTNFLNIFPSHAERGEFYQANAKYEATFENDILIFVSHATREEAIAGANELVQRASVQEIFSSLQIKFAGENFDQWVPFLYSKRQNLLTSQQRELIQEGRSQEVLQKALTNIYSPMGMTSQIETDPLNLFQDYFLNTAANFQVKPFNGYLISDQEGKYSVFIRAKINRSAVSFNKDLIDFYETIKTEYQGKNREVAFFGAALFSAFGSEKSMEEVSLYGTLSFVAVIALLIWAFSSVVPVIASLFTVSISVAAGLIAVMWIYSSVHILSILLGISILGIVTDYCTHFFSKGFDSNIKSSEQAIEKIKGALRMGFLTNVLTYLCFYFTDLLVLKQLAIFTIAGIFTTYVTVVACFPLIKFKSIPMGKLAYAEGFFVFWKKIGYWKSISGVAMIALLLIVAQKGARFDDNVKLLQSVPQILKDDEAQVQKLLGSARSSAYFLVRGKTADEVLRKEEQLIPELRKKSLKVIALSNFVPSLERQKNNKESYQKLRPVVESFYKTLGLQKEAAIKNLFSQKNEEFTVADLLQSSSQFPLAQNWLGQIGDDFYSVVNLNGDAKYEDLKTFENQDIHLMNKAVDLSHFLQVLRETIIGQFAVVLVLLASCLLIFWGWRRAVFILFPPVLSALITAFAMQAIYGYLNLFNVLAMILIFCLGMDYSVFFSQSKGSTKATHVGIFISVLSTVGSFGVLGLSSTYAVSSFGVTVFFGICLCYLLSPLAAGAEDV